MVRQPLQLEKVEKPWGYELIWAQTEKYVGKILHIDAGEMLSLQYHQVKDEAILVQKGSLRLILEDEQGELQEKILKEGDSCHISPGKKHRMVALTDTDIIEVSTPELEDVVRLSDHYGRAPQTGAV